MLIICRGIFASATWQQEINLYVYIYIYISLSLSLPGSLSLSLSLPGSLSLSLSLSLPLSLSLYISISLSLSLVPLSHHLSLPFGNSPLTCSEARGPPQFQEKCSRGEKAILGALGEFRVFSEQLSEFKIPFSEYEIPFSEWHPTTWAIRTPQFSEQLPERFPELMGTQMKDFHLPQMKDFHLPQHSWSVFSRIGVVPAGQNCTWCFCAMGNRGTCKNCLSRICNVSVIATWQGNDSQNSFMYVECSWTTVLSAPR